MGVQKKLPFPILGYIGKAFRNAVAYSVTITIGAAGAISSSDADNVATAALGTAGLYTVTLPNAFRKLIGEHVTFIGPAPGVNTVGLDYVVTAVSGTAGTVIFQFVRGSDNAAANVASGTVLTFNVWVAS